MQMHIRVFPKKCWHPKKNIQNDHFRKHPYGIDLIIEDSVLHDGILEHTTTIGDYLLMK